MTKINTHKKKKWWLQNISASGFFSTSDRFLDVSTSRRASQLIQAHNLEADLNHEESITIF